MINLESDGSVDVLHSCDFIKLEPKHKKVLIVGTGKSAQDLLVSLNGNQDKVTVLYDRALWSVLYDQFPGFSSHRSFKLAFALKALLGWKMARPLIISIIKKFMANPFDEYQDPDYWNISLLKRQHVEILKSYPSAHITRAPHVIKNGKLWVGNQSFPADLIIYATGFVPLSQELLPSLSVKESGKTIPFTVSELYRGTMVWGLPNLFIPCARSRVTSSMQSELDALWVTSKIFGKQFPLEIKSNDLTPFPAGFSYIFRISGGR